MVDSTPATRSEIYEIVGALMDAFPAQSRDEKSKANQINSFVVACVGLPVDSLFKASHAFMAGVVPSHKPGWLPSCDIFAIEARRLFNLKKYEILQLEKSQRKRALPAPEMSEAHKKLMRDKFKKLQVDLAKSASARKSKPAKKK